MMMMRIAAMAAIVAGASVGLASPASAEPLSGTYTAEVIGNNGVPSPLTNSPWAFAPCGPDCTRGGDREFRLQGDTWTASSDTDGDGIVCRTTFDNSSLTGMTGCGGMEFPLKLTKVG
jgi:hypothetical protein